MDLISSDILLNVISYLSVKDVSRAQCVSRRFLYVFDTLKRQSILSCQAELAASSSMSAAIYNKPSEQSSVSNVARSDEEMPEGLVPPYKRPRRHKQPSKTEFASSEVCAVLNDALGKLNSVPNFCLCFAASTDDDMVGSQKSLSFPPDREELDAIVMKTLPPETSFVFVEAHGEIQSNIAAHGDLNNGIKSANGNIIEVDCESRFNCMMGAFLNSHVVPFLLTSNEFRKRTGIVDVSQKDNQEGAANRSPNADLPSPDVVFQDCINDAIKQYLKSSSPMFSESNDLKRAQAPEQEFHTDYWKLMIIFVSGSGMGIAENLLSSIQKAYPKALIVGGVCESGKLCIQKRANRYDKDAEKTQTNILKKYNAMTTLELKKSLSETLLGTSKHLANDRDTLLSVLLTIELEKMRQKKRRGQMIEVEDGIFGLIVGGEEVPVRSVVSQGLKGRGSDRRPEDHLDARYLIDESDLIMPQDAEAFPFDQGVGKIYHPCHKIEYVLDFVSGKRLHAIEFLATVGQGDGTGVLGIKRMDGDGYQITEIIATSDGLWVDTGGIADSFDSLIGSEIDFFVLHGQEEDMERTMATLRDQLKNEKILGAIMFSCNGRGPRPNSLVSLEMADATIFSKYFNLISCIGFYAGGEIGPRLVTGAQNNVFRHGTSALQGFTAVFLVIIVPVQRPLEKRLSFDESPERIDEFMRLRARQIGIR